MKKFRNPIAAALGIGITFYFNYSANHGDYASLNWSIVMILLTAAASFGGLILNLIPIENTRNRTAIGIFLLAIFATSLLCIEFHQ